MKTVNTYRIRNLIGLAAIACLLLASMTVAPVSAQVDPSDYRGNVYVEIRIDDNGIILIDSTGTETMVPLGSTRDDGSAEDLRSRAIDLQINPDDYPNKRSRINAIGKSVVVEEDEHVYGSVTALGGNVTIRGLVEGDVTATGVVRLEDNAIVIGDISAPDVIRAPTARVVGRISRDRIFSGPEGPWDAPEHDPTAAFVVCIVYLSILLVFTFITAMLFPKATDRVKVLYHRNILKTLLVGFIVWLLALPVFVLLLITIVGIPVAVPGMPIAMLAASFLGGAAFCLFVSDLLKTGNNGKSESRGMKILMGFIVVQIPTVGFFLGLMVNSEALSIVSGILAGLLNLLVITLGFGGTVLTRFGTRDYLDQKVTIKVEVVGDEEQATT